MNRAIAKLLREHPTPWTWKKGWDGKPRAFDNNGYLVFGDKVGTTIVAIVNSYAASLKKGKKHGKR